MGEAGHKVIVADADPTFGLNMTRFSKYVHSFHLLNSTKTYIEDLIAIFKAEKVDGFIPVSHIQLSINDSYASKGMKMSAYKTFGTLAIPDPTLVEELDNKFQFMAKCQKFGLSVPDFRHCTKNLEFDLRQFHAQNLFNGEKSYFLKPLELQRTERMDFTRIPADPAKFEDYIEHRLKYKDQSVPYILSEFIEGQEYAANILCHQGKLLMCQIVPSTAILQNYQTIDNPKITKWIETFVKETNLSGLLCFDFLEDQAKNVYCIECNPRPHSAIVTINSAEEVN